MSTEVDARSAVSAKARLGNGVRIGPYSVIEDDVVIGDGTWIGSHVVVGNGTRLGRECRIFQGAAVGGPPQDLKYKGEPTLLEVGDRTVVREYVTLNRGTVDSGKTVIGSDCLFMAYTHVAHDCRVGDHVIMANCAPLGGHVHVGDWVIIGGMTPVHQFVHIGEHAMIGGGFRVGKDVPPYVLAGQMPLAFEGLNLIGLRRRGFSREALDALDQAYRILYRSRLNVSQAVRRIREELRPTPEIEKMLAFIEASKRGIIPASRHA